MKRIPQSISLNSDEDFLRQKEERELFGNNPHDYYAIHYRRRIALILSEIRKRTVSGAKVLEAGCAQSVLSLTVAEEGRRAVAMDLQFNFLKFSRRKYEKGTIDWVQGSISDLPFRKQSFDCIILGEILEHCAWPETILSQAKGLLKPAGIIVATTPNNGSSLNSTLRFSSVKNDRSSIQKEQFGPDGDDHLFTFTMSELVSLIKDAGFTIFDKQYICNHFFHLKQLYHIRHFFPWVWNRFFEIAIPKVPFLKSRYTHGLFVVAGRGNG